MRLTQVEGLLISAILFLSLAYSIQPTSAFGFVDSNDPVGFTILAPSTDPIRSQACARIESAGVGIGLNVHCCPVSFFECGLPGALVAQNFQALILGWSFGVVPTYLYDFFSSTQLSVPGEGNNNVHVNDSTLDPMLANYRFACGNATSCASQSQAIETYIFRHGYYFPIYNRASDNAARNDSYVGYYNQFGFGLGFGVNGPFWSLMNAHVAGCTPMPTCAINANNATAGRPFTMGLRDPIQGWNPLSINDNTVFDADVYGMIFDTLAQIDPVTLTPTLPWVGNFTKAPYQGSLTNNKPGTVYHWTLASNSTWSNGAPVTAYDLNWTINLLQGHYGRDGLPTALFLPAITHLTTSVITGLHTIDVYYNSSSFFTDYDANLPIFPSARWNGTDAVMGNANTPGTAAYQFKNSPQTYEPGSFTNITNFFMGSGAYVVESYDSTTGTTTLLNRASTAHPYWRPAPTAGQAFNYLDGAAGAEPTATGSLTDIYHAPWLHEITFVVLGADQSTAITTAGVSGIDLTGWNIPSGSVSTVETNLVSAGKGFFTSPPNFGMFYFAVNLDEGTGPNYTHPFQGTNPANQNPFSDVWSVKNLPTTTTIGPLFRAGLNHLIDRAHIVSPVCGFGCTKLTGMVPPIYNIGGYSFHNSTIDSDPLGTFNPSALNATLNMMASMNLVKFNTNTHQWDYTQAVTPGQAIANPIILLVAFTATALAVRQSIKIKKLSEARPDRTGL